MYNKTVQIPEATSQEMVEFMQAFPIFMKLDIEVGWIEATAWKAMNEVNNQLPMTESVNFVKLVSMNEDNTYTFDVKICD